MRLLPDSLYKNNQLRDEKTSLTIHKLGPEEKFAGTVLKSLKEKIEDARKELESVEEECGRIKEEAEEEKERILQEARDEAEQIIEEAETEAEDIVSSEEAEVEKAREKGYEEGYQEAVDDAQEKTAELIEQGERILDEARRERNSFLAGLDEEFLALLSRMAQRVVREYVELDSDVVLRIVRDTIEQVREVHEISIVLHPEDYGKINDVVEKLRDEHPSLEEITLVEDKKMDRGGCRIHTEFGDIEGTVNGQIEHLSEQLLSRGIISELDPSMEQTKEDEDDDVSPAEDTVDPEEKDTDPPKENNQSEETEDSSDT